MKEKIMLIAGCSHASGSEIDGTPDSAYNRQHSFGGLLAAKLGYKPVNIAIAGNSNSGMARNVLRWFEANYNPDTMEIFVLVAWSDSTRLEVPVDRVVDLPDSTQADWLDTTTKKFYRPVLGWDGDPDTPGEVEMTKSIHRFIAEHEMFVEIMSINYVLQLEYFLKSKNVNYVMCNTMPMFRERSTHLDFYLNLVDATKYYEVLDVSQSFFPKFRALGYVNPKAKYWHHGETPHAMFADELYNFIEANNVFNQMV